MKNKRGRAISPENQPRLVPGFRIGVGEGMLTVLNKPENELVRLSAKPRKNSDRMFEFSVPEYLALHLLRIENLERRADNFRKQKDYHEKRANEAESRTIELEQAKDKANLELSKESEERERLFYLCDAKTRELEQMQNSSEQLVKTVNKMQNQINLLETQKNDLTKKIIVLQDVEVKMNRDINESREQKYFYLQTSCFLGTVAIVEFLLYYFFLR